MTFTTPPNAMYHSALHLLSQIDLSYPLKPLADSVHPSPILTEPPTPSSTATIRALKPSQITDDDILANMSPISRVSITRRSSRTYRWIEDQQTHLTPSLDTVHPVAIAAEETNGRVPDANLDVTQLTAIRPDTPTPNSTRKARNSQAIFHASSPLRSLHLTFSSRRNSSVPAPTAHRPHSPNPSAGTFRRNQRTASHSRGSSLSTVNNTLQRESQRHAHSEFAHLPVTPPKTTAWKFKRPSVAGHFIPPSSDHSDNGSPPPRPSTSSSITAPPASSATSTRTSSDAPRKMYFGSIRSHSSTTIFSSSPSLWSLPTDATHINDPPESTTVIARDRDPPHPEGMPMTWKPTSPTNLAGVTSLLTTPRSRKKRKLIISGIPPQDERRFDAVRRWCESFGELNSITRVHNGDLHIDFRRAEVADTVCRLNARVHISGVGSVCLSWFTGKRP